MKNQSIDIITFWEILWDIIDGVPHLGGAPFNLAAHASLCALDTAVISSLGEEELGDKARVHAEELNINTQWIGCDPTHPTGTVTVKLVNAIPEYTIHEQVAWDNIVLTGAEIQEISDSNPKAFCFGSLAQRSKTSRATLAKLLEALPATLRFFDVNLRQHYWSPEIIKEGLNQTNWLKANDEEALILNQKLFNSAKGLKNFASNVLTRYSVKGVLITCGANGCIVFEKGKPATKSPAVDVEVINTVGAGDAFSAAFLTALLRGKSAEMAAMAGNRRGAMVASKAGAIPIVSVSSTV